MDDLSNPFNGAATMNRNGDAIGLFRPHQEACISVKALVNRTMFINP